MMSGLWRERRQCGGIWGAACAWGWEPLQRRCDALRLKGQREQFDCSVGSDHGQACA